MKDKNKGKDGKPCKATSAPEVGKSGRGQDIPLKCDRTDRHLVHKDETAGASFIGRNGPVWPSRS